MRINVTVAYDPEERRVFLEALSQELLDIAAKRLGGYRLLNDQDGLETLHAALTDRHVEAVTPRQVRLAHGFLTRLRDRLLRDAKDPIGVERDQGINYLRAHTFNRLTALTMSDEVLHQEFAARCRDQADVLARAINLLVRPLVLSERLTSDEREPEPATAE